MGEINTPLPVQHFCGVIFAPGTDLDTLKTILEKEFGPIDSTSDIFDFDNTSFYEKEMGQDLKKIFFSFEKLIPPGDIAAIKIRTNELEEEATGKIGAPGRPINLDPGYVGQPKMVLATTKDNYHRLYLRDGIYAEVTLRYTNKTFQPMQWTYPDYCTQQYIDYFNQLRTTYREKLKNV